MTEQNENLDMIREQGKRFAKRRNKQTMKAEIDFINLQLQKTTKRDINAFRAAKNFSELSDDKPASSPTPIKGVTPHEQSYRDIHIKVENPFEYLKIQPVKPIPSTILPSIIHDKPPVEQQTVPQPEPKQNQKHFNFHYPAPQGMPNLNLPANVIRTNAGRGLIPGGKRNKKVVTLRNQLQGTRDVVSIPSSFDWRTHTVGPDDLPALLGVRDQGACGSCYAYAAVGALSSVISIATDGATRLNLSPQDMINCGPSFSDSVLNSSKYASQLQGLIDAGIIPSADWYTLQGCDGGLLVSSMDYLVMVGAPSETDAPATSATTGVLGTCNNSQTLTRYKGSKAVDLTFGAENGFPPYVVNISPGILAQNVENMQLSIMTYGPIIAGFNIYTDFLYYPQISEVYVKRSSFTIGEQTISVVYEGSHAIQIIGWGETTDGSGNPLPYWICQNQWGTDWGIDGGYFYIKRGSNEANIELDAISIQVNPSDLTATGTLYPLSSSTGSAGLAWWAWTLIAIAIAMVIAIVVTVCVIFAPKSGKGKNPKVEVE